jgi:hypothetical protein
MAYMLGPAQVRFPAITTVLESTPVHHDRLGSLADSVSTPSALAHTSMAAAMVFMLTRS